MWEYVPTLYHTQHDEHHAHPNTEEITKQVRKEEDDDDNGDDDDDDDDDDNHDDDDDDGDDDDEEKNDGKEQVTDRQTA